jgi:hypothetical protein
VTQPTNGNEGIESATASAAAILSQLNEMVQGQQQQQQNAHLSSELLATTDPSRLQSEKVKAIKSPAFARIFFFFRKEPMHF